MRNEKSRKDPLLYIHQPKGKTPGAHMQNDYFNPRKDSGIDSGKGHYKSGLQRRTIRKSSYFKSRHLHDEAEEEDVVSEMDEENEQPEQPEEPTRPSRNKKFKDMTLVERVQYFAYAPSTSPKLRCEVKTYERSYRGKIVDFIENEVYMRIGRRKSPEKIPFEEIRDIRLLGF